MESLKGITNVRFNDFSEYDSDKCHNGGCYGFWTDYTRLENGLLKSAMEPPLTLNTVPFAAALMITMRVTTSTCVVNSALLRKQSC